MTAMLRKAADTLRANSNYASNEYFMPVMGLIFLRHAYSRYLAVRAQVEPHLPKRGGKSRPLTKDRARSVIAAMESIEADYTSLQGVLPNSEYQELDNDVLGQMLRFLNPEELKRPRSGRRTRVPEPPPGN